MYGHLSHEPRVVAINPERGATRETLGRAKASLDRLPDGRISEAEAVKEIFPYVVNALARGATPDLCYQAILQAGMRITDRDWEHLKPRLMREAAERRQQS